MNNVWFELRAVCKCRLKDLVRFWKVEGSKIHP
uniref:Uncharacterized protein n=1 Tax=Anguilla anguilla TaxID=7936 RepID=A0A0E9XS16_ANGAN